MGGDNSALHVGKVQDEERVTDVKPIRVVQDDADFSVLSRIPRLACQYAEFDAATAPRF